MDSAFVSKFSKSISINFHSQIAGVKVPGELHDDLNFRNFVIRSIWPVEGLGLHFLRSILLRAVLGREPTRGK